MIRASIGLTPDQIKIARALDEFKITQLKHLLTFMFTKLRSEFPHDTQPELKEMIQWLSIFDDEKKCEHEFHSRVAHWTEAENPFVCRKCGAEKP